jgi:hypothetical protein
MVANPPKKNVRHSSLDNQCTRIQEVAREKRVSVDWIVHDAMVQHFGEHTSHVKADARGGRKEKK